MAKWTGVIFLLIFFSLQSCQSTLDAKTEKQEEKTKRTETVSYNLQLGLGYLKQGDNPRAKRKLLHALDLEPNSPETNGAMAFFLEKIGETDEAQRYYLKALSLSRHKGAEYNNYGTFLCHQKKYAEAERYFLKAVEDTYYLNSGAAYENAGLCAAAIPDYKKAQFYFKKALDQDPTRKQSLYELTSLVLKQNDSKKAWGYLQKYQELSLSDQVLLSMAIKTAHEVGEYDIEADYKLRLSRLSTIAEYSGENNEYSSNG